MALTQAQLDTHWGRLLRFMAQVASTDEEKARLADLVQLLAPYGRRYIQEGTGSTLEDRREAMQRLRTGAYRVLTGVDADVDADAMHRAIAHEWQGKDAS